MTSTHQQAPIASVCRRCFTRPSSARASRGALRARPTRRVASRALADGDDDASSSGSSSAELTVTTFNVLAPCYKRVKSPDGSVAMEATYPEIAVDRQTRIVDMLSELASSIVCLQVRPRQPLRHDVARDSPPTFPHDPALPTSPRRSSGTPRRTFGACTSAGWPRRATSSTSPLARAVAPTAC